MRRAIVAIFSALMACASLARANDLAEDIIVHARNSCEMGKGAAFSLSANAITRIDVTGDGATETLIDSCGFVCTGAASTYGGSAGCPLTIVKGEKSWRYFKQAWTVEDWLDKPIILLWLHGTSCGGAGVDPCALALVWNGHDFVSVLDKQ